MTTGGSIISLERQALSADPDEHGTATPAPATWLHRHRDIARIMGVALLFRLVLATQTIVHQPDEVWQYLEPAYGMVTGHWIVAWEFHAGVRGWLVPMMLVPMVALGHALAPTTQLHIWLVRLVLSVLSLGVVASFYDLGGRISRSHALMAGWVGAIWVEIFYFAPRSSGEAIAVSLLMPAIALLYRLRDHPAVRTAIAIGFLLMLGAIVRFQYLPAITLIVVWHAGHRPRQMWWSLLLGAVLALGLGAMADALAGQVPFLWIYTNYTINLGQSRSAHFGTAAPDWYLARIIATWGWCSLVLVPATIVGARRLPMLLAVALVIIGCHMLVPHKEYRFVLLAVVLVILLAAVGTVDLAQWVAARKLRPGQRVMPLLGGLWLAMSVMVAIRDPFASFWGPGRAAMTTLVDAGQRPDICGLAIFRPTTYPLVSRAFLNRDVPILLFDGPIAATAAAANQTRFNVAIAPRLDASGLPRGFVLDHCMAASQALVKQKFCTYVRPGGCRGGAGDFDYNLVLARLDH